MENNSSLMVCYACRTMQEPIEFKATCADPLAQICNNCKSTPPTEDEKG